MLNSTQINNLKDLALSILGRLLLPHIYCVSFWAIAYSMLFGQCWYIIISNV